MTSIPLDPAWIPNIDPALLVQERGWLSGTILTGVGYGIVVTLSFMCMASLIPRYKANMNIFWIAYVGLIFIFATMFITGDSKMAELSFVTYRNFDAGDGFVGPAAFETLMFALPISEVGNVAFVLSNWFADAIVVWRCIVVYKGSSVPWWTICIIPIAGYLTSWIFGLLWLVQVSATSPWAQNPDMINFTLPYFWSSFALNVLMTLMISIRLLVYRFRISKVMGGSYGKQYTSIASMIVESALLYTGFQLTFIVLFGTSAPLQVIFLQPLSQVQCIAPLLIIYRVSAGNAWTTETSTHIFNSRPSDIEMRKNVQLPSASSKSNTLMSINGPMTFAKTDGLTTTTTTGSTGY